MMKKILFFALGVVMFCARLDGRSSDVPPCHEYMDAWKEGYMDIHQISTGRGNAAFLILPDGTTMLVDMGDLGAGRGIAVKSSEGMTAAQRVERYIRNIYDGERIDYCLITHYHNDHMGAFDKDAPVSDKGYLLQGITHFAELMQIDRIVDRSWPEYSPSALGTVNYEDGIEHYESFMKFRDAEGQRNERFVLGSDSQFSLLKNPEAYPGFKVRNLVANMSYWNGCESVPIRSSNMTDENRYSCGICISYGDFDWLSAGDAKGGTMEAVLAGACGAVEAAVCNHHAYSDAMSEDFVKAVQARVWIVPACKASHPHKDALQRIFSRELYSAERSVFSTGIVEENRTLLESYGGKTGHIVIRVYEGGKTWQVFVLNDGSKEYEVIHKTGIMNARSQTSLEDFVYGEL